MIQQEADVSHRPLRPPPGLGCFSRSPLTNNEDITDWLRLLLEAGDAKGEVRGRSNIVSTVELLGVTLLSSVSVDVAPDDQQVPVFSEQLLWNPY